MKKVLNYKFEIINLLLLVCILYQFFSPDSTQDKVIFFDVEDIKNLAPIDPFELLYMLILRIPLPFCFYYVITLLHQKLYPSVDNKKYVNFFFNITISIAIFNILFYALAPMFTYSTLLFIKDGASTNEHFYAITQAFASFNGIVMSTILLPFIEALRFVIALLVMKDGLLKNLTKTKVLLAFAVAYELICGFAAYLELFDYNLFGVDPALYNIMRSSVFGLTLVALSFFMFIKHCMKLKK